MTTQQLTDINLFPCFTQAVKAHSKTSTLKIGDKRADYKTGDELNLTAGWNIYEVQKLARIRLTEVKNVRINKLTDKELSSECIPGLNAANVPFILSLIYRFEVNAYNWVTLLRWEYI